MRIKDEFIWLKKYSYWILELIFELGLVDFKVEDDLYCNLFLVCGLCGVIRIF